MPVTGDAFAIGSSVAIIVLVASSVLKMLHLEALRTWLARLVPRLDAHSLTVAVLVIFAEMLVAITASLGISGASLIAAAWFAGGAIVLAFARRRGAGCACFGPIRPVGAWAIPRNLLLASLLIGSAVRGEAVLPGALLITLGVMVVTAIVALQLARLPASARRVRALQ